MTLFNLSTCADLTGPIADAALPALACMVHDAAQSKCRLVAAEVLGHLAEVESLCRPVADAALQGLTALLEVRGLLHAPLAMACAGS